jgi:hypothetical protein
MGKTAFEGKHMTEQKGEKGESFAQEHCRKAKFCVLLVLAVMNQKC